MLGPNDIQNFGDILYSWTAAIPLITTGISALAGLFGKKQQQQQTQNTNSTTNTSGTQQYSNTTTPEYDSYSNQIKNYIMGKLVGNTQQSQSMAPYLASGIKSINQGADLKSRLLQSTLAARGLSGSPMAAFATAGADSQRNADIVNLEGQMPILQRQMQNEDMANLSKFFASLPVGNASSGTSSSTGTSNTQGTTAGSATGIGGGGVGDMLSGLGQGLAASYGKDYWLQQLMKNQNGVQSVPEGTGYSDMSAAIADLLRKP